MTKREIALWALIAASLALGFVAISVSAAPARAGEYVHPIYEHGGYQQPRRARRVRRHVRREPRYDRETVRLYRSMDDEYDGCRGPVRGVGTQWLNEEGALDAAVKDWRERTRYDHGEIFVDMTHALDFRKRCGRTSIGEVAGQVFYRCEVWARPCKAEFSEGVAKK